jgi:hypothetical protein
LLGVEATEEENQIAKSLHFREFEHYSLILPKRLCTCAYTQIIKIIGSRGITSGEYCNRLLHPYPYPIKECANILFRESIIGQLQPTLSYVAGGLDRVAKVITPFRPPFRDTEPVSVDFVAQNENDKYRDLGGRLGQVVEKRGHRNLHRYNRQ